MSYLYGCEVIKCSCDVMHTDCDVIHRVCVMSYGELVWYSWCTDLDDTDRVDVVSDIVGRMSRINAYDDIQNVVWSHKIWVWCLIEFIWYWIYSGWDVLHTKGVISLKKWVWWHTFSSCDMICNEYYVIIYSGWDLKNSVGVISSRQWMWSHRHSIYDVKYSACGVLKMVAWYHKASMWGLV